MDDLVDLLKAEGIRLDMAGNQAAAYLVRRAIERLQRNEQMLADQLEQSRAAPDLLEAARLQEAADDDHLSCNHCDPADHPSTCAYCVVPWDKALLARRAAIAKATEARS